jgi:hypothetical protein
MPAVNDKILKVDYNSIRDKVIGVLGSGSGNNGYGQQTRIQSTAVTDDSKVTINEWANLRYDIINAYKHQNGSNPTTAVVAEGNTIRYTGSFTPDTGTLDVPQKQYDDWANNLSTNRFAIAESGTTSVVSSSKTTSWVSQCECIIQVYWANSNDARYWFNSGGKVRISASRSGGAATNQNTAWTNLLSAMGTQSFGGAFPDVGTTPNIGTNWYRTTSTFQTYYTGTSSSPYGANNVKLQARCVDPTLGSNSGGSASQLEIKVLFTDGYVDPGIAPLAPPKIQVKTTADYPPDDVVDGTLTVNVSTLFATGIMVPAATTFTVTQPIIAVGAVSGS